MNFVVCLITNYKISPHQKLSKILHVPIAEIEHIEILGVTGFVKSDHHMRSFA